MYTHDIHTHTPARTSSTNFQLNYLLYTFVLQTVLGRGMRMSITAQAKESDNELT